MDLNNYIRDIPDFPKKGIVFKDITTLLSDSEAYTKTIDMLNNLGVSWLGIAHTPKYDETVYYGNSQYEAGADVMLRHTSTVIDDIGSIALLVEVTKANDLPIPKPMGLHYGFDDLGLNSIRLAKKEEVQGLYTDVNLYRSIADLMDEFGSGISATSLGVKLPNGGYLLSK